MSQDSVSAINNWGNLMSDPYFQAAFQSYNPNFRASQTQIAVPQENTSVATATSVPSFSGMAAPEESSGTGLLIGGAVATALTAGALIYAHKRGNGKILEGFKDIYASCCKIKK